jgi:hypothetical protein
LQRLQDALLKKKIKKMSPTVKTLIKAGAAPDFTEASQVEKVSPTVEQLIKAGAAPDFTEASQVEKVSPIVEQLIKAGATPDFTEASPVTKVSPTTIPLIQDGKNPDFTAVGKIVKIGEESAQAGVGGGKIEVTKRDASMVRVLQLIEMLTERFTFFHDRDGLYYYDEVAGISKLIQPPSLRLQDDFQGFAYNNLPEYKLWLSDKVISKIYGILLKDDSYSTLMPQASEFIANFKNVAVDIRTNTVIPRSAALGLKFTINANYHESGELAERSLKFFLNLGNGAEGAKQILAGGGLSVLSYRRLQRCQMLYGLAKSGKSVWGDLLMYLFELYPEYAEQIALDEFGGRFVTGNFVKAKCIVGTELGDLEWSPKIIRVLKQLVTCDGFYMERKNVQGKRQKPQAFLTFMGNEIPKMRESMDPGQGVLRRIWPIKTGQPVKVVDRHMLEALEEDADAIANVAVRMAWKYICHEELIPAMLPEELYSEDAQVANLSVDDAINQYLTSAIYFTGVPTDVVPLQEILEALQRLYPDVTLIQVMERAGLSKHLRKILGSATVIDRYKGEGRVLFNYKWKNKEENDNDN